MAKIVDYAGRPSSGTVPYAVVGIVTDNMDPDGLARVKVKFPTLQEEPTSYWLRQVSPAAGPERGFFCIPEPDDEVLVVFMQGSQDVGVIVGQFWNGQDAPPTIGDRNQHDSNHGVSAPPGSGEAPDSSNDLRFWKSKSGHMFIFDDSTESVEIWDKGGNMSLVFNCSEGNIQLSNADGSIEISASKDVSITAGDNFKYYAGKNIEGEAGMDMKVIAGMNYEFEASLEAKHKALNIKFEADVGFEAKGGVQAKVEGSAMAEFKGGGMATFEGSGLCMVKGGMVMVN